MTARRDPYRSLPVVTPAPRAVCAWCKHARQSFPPHGVLVCDGRARVEPCAVAGSVVVDRGRDCYVVRSSLLERGDAGCPDFEPSIVTRLLRAIGWRR